MSGGTVSGNTASIGGGVYVSDGTFSMSGGAVSGNTVGPSSSGFGGGVHILSGTFNLSGGAVSGNTSSSYGGYGGGGVYVNHSGTFSMSGGAVSGNTTSNDSGGGVDVSSGTFSMSGGTVSGNSSPSSGGGVYVEYGTLSMSGGTVRDNVISGSYSYGREVLLRDGTFKLSGAATPQRVFLYDTSRHIAISGPLNGGPIPIDLGISSSVPLSSYESAQILRLDGAYSGNLAELKEHFSLGDAKRTDSSNAGTPISGYTINDGGYFVTE
jgi:predicted outer membrane repeat protein